MLVSFVPLLALAGLVYTNGALAQDNNEGTDTREISRREFAVAINAFGLDLYQALRPHEGNLVMSPPSASIALVLAWMGAAGRTAEQLGAALHLPTAQERVAEGVRALIDTLQGTEGATVRIANKMFIHNNFTVKDTFRQQAVSGFRSGFDSVDFMHNTEAARQTINNWVEQNTDGKIQNLFVPGSLSAESVLVLVNAIYFKGEWMKAFKEDQTRNSKFHTSLESSVTVPMMKGIFRASHASIPEFNASAVELLYKGSEMRMLLLLPDAVDGLQQLEDNLSAINFTEVDFYPWDVEVQMPKYNIKSSLSLKGPLEKLGVNDLFSPNCNLTNLTPDPNIEVSKVLQKAYVEVNENGTVAAAATGVEFVARSGRRRIAFKCDHPFLFFIKGADNTILFMGRVADPTLG